MRLFQQLTPREEEVLKNIAQGYSNETIARRLGISVFTVQNHAKKLYDRLGVQGRGHAISLYWQRHVDVIQQQ